MSLKIAVVMDPIESININKDSTFAMLLAAQSRGWELYYLQLGELSLHDGEAHATVHRIRVEDDPGDWFSLQASEQIELRAFDVILMRKDPPFDMEYIYATYILQRAQDTGTLVVNRPDSLREANEKLFTAWFPQCCAPMRVTRKSDDIKSFLKVHNDIILKPLGGMGGASIFRVKSGDPNLNVIIETMTAMGRQFCMVQKFIPEIVDGDKRILLIDGEPVPYALARIPAAGETRGNLAAGGTGEGVALTERDYWICEQLAPSLKQMGLIFVGIDVIGDYLTEINVTSPTCIRELDKLYDLDIAGQLMDAIEAKCRVS